MKRLLVIIITCSMLFTSTGLEAFASSESDIDMQAPAAAAQSVEDNEEDAKAEEKAKAEAEAKAKAEAEAKAKAEAEAKAKAEAEEKAKAEAEAKEKAEAAKEAEAKAEDNSQQKEEELSDQDEVSAEKKDTGSDSEAKEESKEAEEAAEEESYREGKLTAEIKDQKKVVWKVTVAYGADAEIPDGAELKVTEVPNKEYKDYLKDSVKALDKDIHSISYAKLLDISIVKDGKEYQPDDKVKVTVKMLEEAAEAVDDVKVIHFAENKKRKDAAEELKASTDGTTVTFRTDGFSVFSFLDFSLEKQKVNADFQVKTGTLYENDSVILSGKMPAQGIVEAKRVDVEIGGEKALDAYDIKIYANEQMKALGINWQPGRDAIHVTMKSDAFDVEKVNVYHMKDENSAAELVAEDVAVKNGHVSFDAESFSIYPVSDVTTNPRIFYTFFNGSSVLAAEYITNISEFYDPGVSPEYGQTFLGWAYDPAETDESQMFTWSELKAQLTQKLAQPYADGTEIKVYAKFKEAYYLRYMVVEEDETVGVLKSDSVRTDAADKTRTVDCEYSVVGENFRGWIDAASGTLYQNGDTITLDKHIDLYAKVSGRYWLVFNANATGATFTGPQLIYGDRVTKKPNQPTKKGYIFKGWNTKADGTGTWWSKAGDDSVNGFGTSITEDTTLYAQWEGAANSYTVIYWKQKATDEAGLDDAAKAYDYIESQTITGVKTGDAVTLPNGYNNKATATDVNSNYYQTEFGRADNVSKMTVAADGSTVVNVYYDRLAYHLSFQLYGYVYTVSTNDNDNNPAKYGDVNGQKARVYWNNGAFRTSNSRYGTVYSGTVYTRSNNQSWQTVKDIHALYDHNIVEQFPIVGTNGVTYTAARWDPQTNNVGWNEVMSIVYSMPAGNVTFQLDEQDRPTKTVNYYIEALPDDSETVSAPSALYNKNSAAVSTNKRFTLLKSVDMKYNGVTEEDLLDILGFDFLGTDSKKNNNGFWIYSTTSIGTLNVYYTRKTYRIDFVSQGAHVTNNSTQAVENVPYGAAITDYIPKDPQNGEEGYFFDGWYKDQACVDGTELTNADIMPDGNAIFYAKWSTYRVRVVFDPQCDDYWFANNQATTFRTDYAENVSFGNIKPGVAKRPGYKLTGWYLTPDHQADSEVDTDALYQITNTTEGVDMDYQSSADWTNNTYGDNDGAHDDVKGILKFYARWQLDIKDGAVYFLYEVEDGFCIKDGAGNNQTTIPVDSVAHAPNTSVQIAEAPEGYIDGVDFTNWMVLNQNGGATSVMYNPNDTVMLTPSEWEDYIDTITVTDDEGHVGTMNVVRLRARFTAKEDKATTILFNGNGGTMSGGAASFTEVIPLNATIDLAVQSASFTRDHYSIIGWNTKADGSGDAFPVDELLYANNENLEPGEPNKLYAMWLPDIEVVAAGPEEEVIYDGEQHSNTKPYTFSYMLGGEEKTLAELQAMGLRVSISEEGWPVAEGTEKGTYTARELTDRELASLITINDAQYHAEYKVVRVYRPAKLIVRDLMLTITKTVTGEYADPNEAFTFKLQDVAGVTSGMYHATIIRKIEGTTTEVNLQAGSTFWMRDGDTVKIEGLPKGRNITLTENNGSYKTSWELNGQSVPTGESTGVVTISLDGDSTLAVTNDLPAVAPTGYSATQAPFVFMGLFGLILLAVALMGRRRREQEFED